MIVDLTLQERRIIVRAFESLVEDDGGMDPQDTGDAVTLTVIKSIERKLCRSED